MFLKDTIRTMTTLLMTWVDAANNFISSLNKEEQSKAIFDLDDDHRDGWYFMPDKFIKPTGKTKRFIN